MLLTNEIIKEIRQIKSREVLLGLLQYLKKARQQESISERKPNAAALKKLIGSISDEEADEMMGIIDREFNNIEGDW